MNSYNQQTHEHRPRPATVESFPDSGLVIFLILKRGEDFFPCHLLNLSKVETPKKKTGGQKGQGNSPRCTDSLADVVDTL